MKSHKPALNRNISLAVLLASLSFAPGQACANTASSQFTVSATVLSACIVVTTELLFGNYTSSAGTPLDATSSVTVTCTSGTPFTVSLNAGTGSGATIAARSMTNTTNNTSTLGYNLYTNSSRTTIWGDGTNSTSTNGTTAGITPTIYTVYGRVATAQYVTNGNYSDLVTATVTY